MGAAAGLIVSEIWEVAAADQKDGRGVQFGRRRTRRGGLEDLTIQQGGAALLIITRIWVGAAAVLIFPKISEVAAGLLVTTMA
jgi:hypothetical protein